MKFVAPEIEVVKLITKDVVTTSPPQACAVPGLLVDCDFDV